jgi:uncharacterized surface protein with fasciclin (FAS1) repeats
MTDTTPTPTLKNLVETVAANDSFKTFSRAVENAGLSDSLRATGPFTIFAPTDAAFEKLQAGRLNQLFQPENKAELASLVNYPVLNGRKFVGDMKSWVTTRTMNGQSAKIKTENRNICINDATVTSADINSSNGVVHGIDAVNIPTMQ